MILILNHPVGVELKLFALLLWKQSVLFWRKACVLPLSSLNFHCHQHHQEQQRKSPSWFCSEFYMWMIWTCLIQSLCWCVTCVYNDGATCGPGGADAVCLISVPGPRRRWRFWSLRELRVQRWAHINSQLRRPDCVTHDDDKLKQTQQGNEQRAEYFLQTGHSGNIHKRNVTHQHVHKPYRTHADTNRHGCWNTLNLILTLVLRKREDVFLCTY